jgi:hypothetical protein
MILNLEVAVNGEYVDYVDSTMNISDLVSYELLPACDILSDTLCATYQALPMLEGGVTKELKHQRFSDRKRC